jgi:hypothetical protein
MSTKTIDVANLQAQLIAQPGKLTNVKTAFGQNTRTQ